MFQCYWEFEWLETISEDIFDAILNTATILNFED
jgi:hypothetical protein